MKKFICGKHGKRDKCAKLAEQLNCDMDKLFNDAKEDMSDYFKEHILQWLKGNEKKPSEVRYGHFPLGMVQRWIERAQKSEAEIRSAGAEIRSLQEDRTEQEEKIAYLERKIKDYEEKIKQYQDYWGANNTMRDEIKRLRAEVSNLNFLIEESSEEVED